MSESIHSQRFLRQRKFLLVLPVLTLPFVVLLLWVIGVVGPVESKAQISAHGGLNLTLPVPAESKDSTWTKMNFYEQADRDAQKIANLVKNDPYRKTSLLSAGDSASLPILPKTMVSAREAKRYGYDPSSRGGQRDENEGKSLPYDPSSRVDQRDENEEKVYRKIAELNAQLAKNDRETAGSTNNESAKRVIRASPLPNDDVDRLELMMQQLQGADSGDPEMQRINGMLDKILKIQHPEGVEEKIRSTSLEHKQQVYPVQARVEDNFSMLGHTIEDSLESDSIRITVPEHNAFYSIGDDVGLLPTPDQNVIRATVGEEQTLVSGSTVKLQLLNDVFINGIYIPGGQFVYGMASLNGERLEITIESIHYLNNILPVALSVYDLDGLPGIYVPGSITRDVSKRSAQQAIQGLGIASLDPSLGAQVASAGIQAAKSLLTKQAKLARVTIRPGYELLLVDSNKKLK